MTSCCSANAIIALCACALTLLTRCGIVQAALPVHRDYDLSVLEGTGARLSDAARDLLRAMHALHAAIAAPSAGLEVEAARALLKDFRAPTREFSDLAGSYLEALDARTAKHTPGVLWALTAMQRDARKASTMAAMGMSFAPVGSISPSLVSDAKEQRILEELIKTLPRSSSISIDILHRANVAEWVEACMNWGVVYATVQPGWPRELFPLAKPKARIVRQVTSGDWVGAFETESGDIYVPGLKALSAEGSLLPFAEERAFGNGHRLPYSWEAGLRSNSESQAVAEPSSAPRASGLRMDYAYDPERAIIGERLVQLVEKVETEVFLGLPEPERSRAVKQRRMLDQRKRGMVEAVGIELEKAYYALPEERRRLHKSGYGAAMKDLTNILERVTYGFGYIDPKAQQTKLLAFGIEQIEEWRAGMLGWGVAHDTGVWPREAFTNSVALSQMGAVPIETGDWRGAWALDDGRVFVPGVRFFTEMETILESAK